ASDQESKELFDRLSRFEISHKELLERIAREMGEDLEDVKTQPDDRIEGGMTSDEFMEHHGIDLTDPVEILSFGMAVEAQAMDLYTRAENQTSDEVRSLFHRLAGEEKKHLKILSSMMDRQTGGQS
ncbi:MAG: ferritin-like domain-containing protein, partial [Desulfovibrionales bacterium]